MRTVRLNDNVRRKILERLATHSFGKRRESVRKEQSELGDAVYDVLYPKDVKRQMRKLPEGFLEKYDHVQVSFAGTVDHVSFTEPRLLAARHTEFGATAFYFADDHPLTQRHADLVKVKEDLAREEEDALRQARAVVNHSYTVKQLLAAWPECRPFVDDFLESDSPEALALAIPVAELNRRFGLETVKG
jgi:hypothetical protein